MRVKNLIQWQELDPGDELNKAVASRLGFHSFRVSNKLVWGNRDADPDDPPEHRDPDDPSQVLEPIPVPSTESGSAIWLLEGMPEICEPAILRVPNTDEPGTYDWLVTIVTSNSNQLYTFEGLSNRFEFAVCRAWLSWWDRLGKMHYDLR